MATGEQHVYLMGGTSFKQYLDFMSSEPLDARTADPKRIADDWRTANNYFQRLQVYEANWPDAQPIQPVTSEFAPLLARVEADAIFQKSFTAVPVEIGSLELDRLVVRQKTINLCQVQRLKQQLGPNPQPEAVFRLCMPFDHPQAPFQARYLANDIFAFTSESNDLRFLEAMLFRADQLRDYQSFGPVAGVLGLVVGFGSNYVNVIAAENRFVLNNGSHRAYALRELGVTQIPCVIQKVTHREELEVVAAGALRRTPDLFLKQPRPPVLKDYFDRQLSKVVSLPPVLRQVRLRFTCEQLDIPSGQ